MQISLKQAEITTALKQYISQQGINLTGKEVAIAFTAGRKESGISAEISIEDTDIPDFFADEKAETIAPTLVLVQDTQPTEDQPATFTVDPVGDPTPVPPQDAPVQTISLFS